MFEKLLFPVQASTFAKGIDNIYLFLVLITVFFTALIFFLVTFFAIRYRRKSEDQKATQIHGSNFFELLWTGIPLVIALFIFFWSTWVFIANSQIPANATEIFVVGKQWMWKLQHPQGKREINELHIPINQPIKLLLASEDVLHSFYVPAFRIKMDAVPGKYTQTWFEATKPGKYHLFCAEYCGTKHSQMIGWVHAMKPEDYQAWLADLPVGNQKLLSPEEQGEALFTELRCITCHAGEATSLGPNLHDLFGSQITLDNGQVVTADANYIRDSILKPAKQVLAGYSPIMPTFENQLTEEQIMALLAYIKSLSKNGQTT